MDGSLKWMARFAEELNCLAIGKVHLCWGLGDDFLERREINKIQRIFGDFDKETLIYYEWR